MTRSANLRAKHQNHFQETTDMRTKFIVRPAAVCLAVVASCLAMAGDDKSPVHLQRASKIIGMNVENPNGEKLGDIHDVAIDLRGGRCDFVILSRGGALGVGDTHT